MGWPRLMLAAVPFNAVVAGVALDRLIVEMPAWRQVGVEAWATYSRHADLGGGLVLYPVAAIGGVALTLAAVIRLRRDATAPRSARIAVYATIAFATLGLLATTQAALYMLSLRTLGDEPMPLQHAFIGFDRWGGIRGVMQILAFTANLWSLVGVTESRRQA